jgi:acetyl esterase/lipase
MRPPVGSLLRSVLGNFGESKSRLSVDRFVVDSLVNNIIPVRDEIRSATRKITLRNCTGVLVSPPSNRLNSTRRSILFCHGGAFCFSLSNLYLPFIYELAVQTGAAVLMPDYRLSPEHPYPAAINDCCDGFVWLDTEKKSFPNLFILGDSAGGNLALNVAQKHGGRGLGLLSPWLDLSQSSQSWKDECDDDVVQFDSARRAAWFYVKGDDWSFGQADPNNQADFARKTRDPSVSPVFGSLDCMNEIPLLLQVSASERLFGDAALLWNRMGGKIPPLQPHHAEPCVHESIGRAKLSVWFDQPHVWQIVKRRSTAGQSANAELIKFINNTLE